MNCKGPCLIHCYKKNTIIILLIGFTIGFVIGSINKKNNNLIKKIE